MPAWGNNAASANDAPSYKILDKYVDINYAANGATLYGNTTIGAFINNVSIGVFAANNLQSGNLNSTAHSAYHAGWVTIIRFTGPILSLTLSSNPGGYTNSNTFSVYVGGGSANANVSFTTNSSGYATGSVTILNGGSFANTDTGNLAYFVANTAAQLKGTTPTFSVTFGGKAGRKNWETLVAMGSMANTMTAAQIAIIG
jgi:hypothetical protein